MDLLLNGTLRILNEVPRTPIKILRVPFSGKSILQANYSILGINRNQPVIIVIFKVSLMVKIINSAGLDSIIYHSLLSLTESLQIFRFLCYDHIQLSDVAIVYRKKEGVH